MMQKEFGVTIKVKPRSPRNFSGSDRRSLRYDVPDVFDSAQHRGVTTTHTAHITWATHATLATQCISHNHHSFGSPFLISLITSVSNCRRISPPLKLLLRIQTTFRTWSDCLIVEQLLAAERDPMLKRWNCLENETISQKFRANFSIM